MKRLKGALLVGYDFHGTNQTISRGEECSVAGRKLHGPVVFEEKNCTSLCLMMCYTFIKAESDKKTYTK